MARLYIFNFDGTSNAPDDAWQKVDEQGNIEDDSITNVLKFHLLCGGSLVRQGEAWPNSNQRSYYYPGIGTYGNKLQKALNTLFAPEGSDVRHILRQALNDFEQTAFNPATDHLLVTGFSRGAALARRFAKLISDQVTTPCIYEAVFDTVASIGMPNLRKSDRPESEVIFENHSLPAGVIKALHLVSLDDKRRAFQPTLMNKESKVTEVWFAGAHADVGGGYHKDGLSDTAMRFCLNWIVDLPLNITIKPASSVNYAQLLPAGLKYQISEDDIIINPDALGFSHEQQRFLPIALMTLCDRLCCVIEDDRHSATHRPLIHWSVAHRIYHNLDYRPESLKGVSHTLIYQDGATLNCHGVKDHIELPQQNLTTLTVGESVFVTVFAAEKFNRTGVFVQSGAQYKFETEEEEAWYDAGIKCGAAGWNREGVTLGIKELAIATMEPFRRVPDADWFCLCGSVGVSGAELFRIGLDCIYTPTTSGELCPFANDLERFYGNNHGRIRCKITRLS